MVVQEQAIVGQGTHAEPDLRKIVEVLQGRAPAEVDAVRDVLTKHHGSHEVINVSCLPCMHSDPQPCTLIQRKRRKWMLKILCQPGKGMVSQARDPWRAKHSTNPTIFVIRKR